MMRPLRRLVLLGLGVAAVVSTATATAMVGLTRRSVPGLPVSVVLPSSWHDVGVPAVVTPVILRRLVKADSAAAVLSNPSYAHQGVRFIGGELEPRGTFSANVNLIVQPLPHDLSLSAWLFGGSRPTALSEGTLTMISKPGAPGLHYESTEMQKIGSVSLLTDVYAFVYDGRVFDFTFTSLAADAGNYRPIFTVLGDSIQFAAP